MPEVSNTMRRYAAEIYRLQQECDDDEFVGVSSLAEYVDASLQAVSRMIRRLKEAGLVIHEPYQGVRLTSAGEREALPAIKRHRLIEVFLVNVMQFGWEETHDLADVFEQGIDDVLEARMDDLTGYPERCPHGDPIPREGVMPTLDDTSITTLEPGAHGTISRVRTHDPDKLRYLEELGIVPGAKFQLAAQAPFNGPLRIRIDRYEHIIGRELAQTIWVEPAAESATNV